MKKLLLILITFFCFSFAQAQHAKIAGVAIDGTINTFQTRIAAKGFKISKMNSYVEAGMRVFSGMFMGEKAELVACYDTKTKLVYRVMVLFSNTYSDADKAKDRVNYIVEKISDKYGFLPNDNETTGTDIISKSVLITGGYATVWAFGSSGEYDYEYNVKVQYDDIINNRKHDNSVSDDL